MATVFGVDLNEIDTNNLIKDDHIETIYGVLSGDPNYSDPDHVINFTGTLMSGSDNDNANNVNFGFAFGENNRVGAESSLVVGKDGESYAEGQFVLSGGQINKRGDAQKYEAMRNLTTTPPSGNNPDTDAVEIPTRDNSISSFEIRLTGAEKNQAGNLVAAQYDLVYYNSRIDPDSSDRGGKILFLDRNWASGGNLDNKSNGFNVEFNVKGNHELEIKVYDSRSSGNDVNWSVHVDGVETFAGKNIKKFGTYGAYGVGYGTAYVSYSGQEGYSNPIAGCFPVGSDVLVKHSNQPEFYKNIEDIKVGDSLLAFTPSHSSFESYKDFSGTEFGVKNFTRTTTRVTDIFYGFKDSVLEINDSFQVSKSQPVFVFDPAENHTKFIEAEKLKTGMKLLNNKKNYVSVQSIDLIEELKEVISLDVEEADVFFVEGLLFHNKH